MIFYFYTCMWVCLYSHLYSHGVPPSCTVSFHRAVLSQRREVISFALLRYMIDLKKNSRHFFIQSEVKPMPIVSCSHAFSRPSCKRHVVTWTFDWFTDFLCPLWLASVITLVLHWFYDTRMKNALFSFIVIGQQNFVGFNWLIWEIWGVTLRWTSIPSRGE